MKLNFSTARLAVRDLNDLAGDTAAREALDAALPVILTEPVLRHLPPDLQHGGEDFDPQSWIATLTSRNDVGVVTEAGGSAPVGFLTAREERPPGRRPHVWIGYLFAEHAWGKGYATELVQGVVDTWHDTDAPDLRAGVAIENAVSMHVLRKAGFVADPESSGDDWTVFTLPKT